MEVPFARYSAVSDRYRAGSFGSTRATVLLCRLRGPLRPRASRAQWPWEMPCPVGARSRGLYRLGFFSFCSMKGRGHQELPNERPRLGELKPALKPAQLLFVVAIVAGKLLLDVGQNRRTHVRGQLRRREHSIDRRGRKARCFVVRFENGPSGASRKSKCSCLLVNCEQPAAARAAPSSLILIACRAL
jgi:hypothetical protein